VCLLVLVDLLLRGGGQDGRGVSGVGSDGVARGVVLVCGADGGWVVWIVICW